MKKVKAKQLDDPINSSDITDCTLQDYQFNAIKEKRNNRNNTNKMNADIESVK